jgi:mannose-1-phosphate guanylyltransferase
MPLTRQIAGDGRPKPFCPVLSSETLLEETRRRVTLLTSPEHILAVVRARLISDSMLLADRPSALRGTDFS